jgi:lysine 2,3-aminomutase
VVLHINHPRELTRAAQAACAKLADVGIPLLSQTVLLKGVNDEPATLAALMRALVETRIKPYYLHHADLAPGTGHLRTSLAEGQQLMRTLRGTVSGLCQPTYVLDIPGGAGKVPVGPVYLRPFDDARYEVEDPNGGRCVYPPGNAP